MSPKLIWYNTKCPVCNAGIEWQRSRLVQAARAGIIEFRDINLEPDAPSRFGASLEDIRRRLHAWTRRTSSMSAAIAQSPFGLVGD